MDTYEVTINIVPVVNARRQWQIATTYRNTLTAESPLEAFAAVARKLKPTVQIPEKEE